MDEKELEELRLRTIARIRHLTPNEIYDMIVSFHSAESVACHNVNYYIDNHNLD